MQRGFGLTLLLAGAFGVAGCQGARYALPSVSSDEIAAATAEIDAAPPGSFSTRSETEALELVNAIGWKLQSVAEPICKQASSQNCRFNFHYEIDSEVNAYAYGERDITMNSGFLRTLTTDDEVASVLAHEIGHHIAGHLRRSRANRAGGGAIGGLLLGLGVALGGGDPASVDHASRMGMGLGAAVGELTFSREQEAEADYLAAYLMARAGYDVEQGRKVWVRFAKQEGLSESGFLDTHPSSAERIVAWRRTIDEIRASPDLMPRWED